MTKIEPPLYSTLDIMPAFFEKQAALTPDAIAVICGDKQIRYDELNQRANQLAWHLQKRSIGPEILVGICLPRSIDMVIAIVGVLKAGGAYVPLDPSYPRERSTYILEDARAPLLITHSSFAPSFSDHQIQLLCLDVDEDIAKNPVEPPVVDVRAEHLAYVIYTSGSTGKPKGVMITHSNLTNFVKIAGMALDVSSSDTYLQTASIAYALSVRQLMIPLAVGATLVVANADEMQDPLSMFQLIKRRRVTLIDMVPSFWRACTHRLSDLPSDELKILLSNSLRRIVSIGEPLLSDLPYEWSSRLSNKAQLVNIFGQTETTGVVATYPISYEPAERVTIVPIGRSVPNTKLYIVDPDLKPVPKGEQGELCVSSPCVARGYLNRRELTSEKFVPNPFADSLSRILYRTGDLARMRRDGNIEFIGRGDQQVKVRGQRLELGEVEAIFREHPSVKDCIVTAYGDAAGERYLAAFIIPGMGTRLTAHELRVFALARLPDYMVPSVFLFLDAFPLTPNGKLDRLALPDPNTLNRNEGLSAKPFVEPRNPYEKAIARTWMDLLKLDRVGIHDDYFDLGGYSLMSVRMFGRIERELGVRLPYTSLFHATTIAQLAELVMNASEEVTNWKIVVPIRTGSKKPAFFGVHAHEGGVLFWREIVSHLPNGQPFYALQARGVDGIQRPLNRIPEMAALYIREIRKVQPKGPYYLGGYSMGGEIAFEMAQQLVHSGEQVNLLAMFDTRNPQRSIRTKTRDETGSILPTMEGSLPFGRLEIVKRKIRGHYLRWFSLNLQQKISYIANQLMVHLKNGLITLLVKFYRSIGSRMPDFLLLHYLRKMHSEALVNYIPEVYPGKITLFRATATLATDPDDSFFGWKPLATGGLEVHYFDAPHEIVSARFAREVAQKLNECLESSRGER